MGERTAIQWTDASWTPIRARNLKTGKVGWHCEHATTGCINCYSESLNLWVGTGLPFKPGHRKDIEIFLDEEMLTAPLRWKRPRMIFVCSMTDAFAEFVTDEMLDRMFAVMALCPRHTFQLLTKRAERMRSYFAGIDGMPDCPAARGALVEGNAQSIYAALHPDEDRDAIAMQLAVHVPLPNVWLGVSAELQPEWDERTEHLRNTPAAVRFVSAEPLLGPIDGHWQLSEREGCANCGDGSGSGRCCDEPLRITVPGIDWVICGGESGDNARPMHPEWPRKLRDDCAAAGVPFFFKQWGAFAPVETSRADFLNPRPEHVGERVVAPDGELGVYPIGERFHVMRRMRKKSAGRLLDGVEHNAFPVPR